MSLATRPRSRTAILVAASCFLCELAAVGVGAGTNSLYTAPICADLEITRTVYSFSVTLMYLVNMAVCFFFPLLLRRIPLRGIFAIGLGAETLAFLTYSSARSVWVLYLGACLLGAGLVLLGAVPITALISSWFPGEEGAMLGIVFAGSGIGGAALIPVAGYLIGEVGWRSAARISAGLMVAVAVLCLGFIREAPGQERVRGLRREGPGSCLRLPGMARALVYAFLTGFSIQPTYLSIAAHLSQRGLSTGQGAALLSAICVVSLVGKVILGALSDRRGPGPALVCSHVGFVLAELSLVSLASALVLPGLFFGFGSIPLTLVLPLLCTRLFRERATQALSYCMAAQTMGIACGILATGLSFDVAGRYDLAFLALGAVNLAAFLVIRKYVFGRNSKERVAQ